MPPRPASCSPRGQRGAAALVVTMLLVFAMLIVVAATNRNAIVETRVGGNGIVATDAIAKARPDGYTLIMGNHSTLAILPHMTKVGYDPARDFVPIALMVAAPNVLVVKADNSKPEPGSTTAHVIPLSGDFFIFGGLYRDVSLIHQM